MVGCIFPPGTRLGEARQHRRAIGAYDRATALLSSLTEARFRAGAQVYSLGYRDESIGRFRRAAKTEVRPASAFDCFYRADASRFQTSGGTGLGLAIVQSIMVLHSGAARKLTVNRAMVRE